MKSFVKFLLLVVRAKEVPRSLFDSWQDTIARSVSLAQIAEVHYCLAAVAFDPRYHDSHREFARHLLNHTTSKMHNILYRDMQKLEVMKIKFAKN